MSHTLTVRTVETIKPGPNRKEIPDRHLTGLYLVVQPSGARSWAVRYRSGSQTRKHTLGSYPAIDLKTARTLASKALRAAAEGRDPGLEKALERTTSPTRSRPWPSNSSSCTADARTGHAPSRGRSSCSICMCCRAGGVG